MDVSISAMLAVAACFAIALSAWSVVVWRTRRAYAGCARWAAANVSLSLGLGVYALHAVVHNPIVAVVANAAVGAGLILLFEATREYCSLRPRVFSAYAAGTCAVAVVGYVNAFQENLDPSLVAMSAFMGMITTASSFTLLHLWRTERSTGVAVSAAAFAAAGALLTARAIYFLFAPPLTDVFAPTVVNSAFFVGGALSIACCSMGWIQLTHDRALTDLKEAQTQTARAASEAAEAAKRAESMARLAEAANASRTEYLLTVNHEIRNPLDGLMTATEVLLDTELTPEQLEFAVAVRIEAETMLKVNDNLLLLSEIEAGRVMIESSPFDLRRVVEDAAWNCTQAAADKDNHLEVDYADGIPRHFHGDAAKISHVLMNLLWNSVMFTCSGRIVVSVACEERDVHGAQMRVSVADTGIGMAPETIASLSQRSSQGPPWASKIQGGAGIGLFVSKKLLELMDGCLFIESQLGKGSKSWFTILLPVEDSLS